MWTRALTFTRSRVVCYALGHLRTVSIAADAKTFVMPKLSPTMTQGRVSKWFYGEGDYVKTYDVICEITTPDLLDDAYRTGKFDGEEHVMEIEVLIAQSLHSDNHCEYST